MSERRQQAPCAPSDDLEFGAFRAGDEPSIFECMRVAFGVEPDVAAWHRLAYQNPAGEALIAVARHRGAVVSYTMFLPTRFRVFGEERPVGHGIDAMTLPSWQRKGLRIPLRAVSRRMEEERGWLGDWAVCNAQSLHMMIKDGGYAALGPLPVMVRPLRPVRTALRVARSRLRRRASSTGAPGDLAAAGPFRPAAGDADSPALAADGWHTPAFDERHSALFGAAEAIPPIAAIRDAPYLEWRYYGSAGVGYLQRDVAVDGNFAATIVVRDVVLYGLRLLVVMEWFWGAGRARDALRLLGDVVRLGRAAGADGVSALAMPGTEQRRLLRYRGFLGLPRILFPRTSVLVVRSAEGGEAGRRWLVPANRYLTWGDGLLL